MNMCSFYCNDVAFETAKTSPNKSALKRDTGFKDMVKSKKSKVNIQDGKENRNLKGKEVRNNLENSNSSEEKSIDGFTPEGNINNITNVIINNFVTKEDGFFVNENGSLERNAVIEQIMPLNISYAANELLSSDKQQIFSEYSTGNLELSKLDKKITFAGDDQLKTANPNDLIPQEDLVDPIEIKRNRFNSSINNDFSGLKNEQKLINELDLNSEKNLGDDMGEGADVFKPFSFETKGETINIKVAEPLATKSWEPVAEEIGEAVVESIKDNKIEKINISLNPKELGEIKVEFVVDNNKVTVSLICSNEKTKSLLSESTSSLSKIIQSNLGQQAVVNVTYNDKNIGQENSRENFDGRGNNGQQQEQSQHNNKRDEGSDKDFLQKLRLGIVNIENGEV